MLEKSIGYNYIQKIIVGLKWLSLIMLWRSPMSKTSRRKNREDRKTSAGHPLNKSERRALRARRRMNLAIVRKDNNATGDPIISRTQANNAKSPLSTVAAEISHYEDIASAQIQVWRALFPSLCKKFAKIKDPRNPKSIKHKITVLLMFGLLQFIFRLPSRRALNGQLTTPAIIARLQSIFPDIDSIPHADTIARLLERIDVADIERVHIDMLRQLINKKNLKNGLSKNVYPFLLTGLKKLCVMVSFKKKAGYYEPSQPSREKSTNNMCMF
jgi:hypothetical protein